MVLRALRDAQQNIAELQETGMQEIRERLLSIEGRAAQRYWGIVRSLLYEQKRQALRFIIVKMNNIGLLLSYSEFTREVKSEHLQYRFPAYHDVNGAERTDLSGER